MIAWTLAYLAAIWLLGFSFGTLVTTFLYLKWGARERWLMTIIMSLFGSRGIVWGPVLGAFILYPLSAYLVFLVPSRVAGQVHLAALGIVLVLVVMFLPDGLIRSYQGWRTKRPKDARPLEARASIVETTG